MTKISMYIRRLSLASVFLMLLAFIVSATNPDYVYIGIALYVICATVLFVVLILAIKQQQYKNDEKEERLKRIERDVDLLKKRVK